MKKIIVSIILIMALVLSFAGCSDEVEDNTQIRIGYMAGPTGMGMAKLVHDNGGLSAGNEKYSFKKYTDTKEAQVDLTSGKIDVICLPTNEAAIYYNTTDDEIKVLAINTLGSLFLLTDGNTTVTDFSELAGKTIYTCKNGTPKIVLEYLLSAAKINATVSTEIDGKTIASPAQLGEYLVAGKLDIAVVPEPIVTSSLLSIKASGKTDINYSVDLSLNDVWNDKCDSALAMGCIVTTSTFANEHKGAINAFLKEYKASIEYISNPENMDSAAKYVVESGVMGKEPAAKSALGNLKDSIAYLDGKKMKTALQDFYKAIGITAPDKDFYYEK
jgi:NitT/TauT family transport system substrate-binding protein